MIDREVGRVRLRPASRIEVFNAVMTKLQSFVGVTAKNSVHVSNACMRYCAGTHLVGKPQPHCVEALQKANYPLSPERYFLQMLVARGEKSAEQTIVNQKAVELMAMNGQVAKTAILPLIFLVDLNSYEVRHHF